MFWGTLANCFLNYLTFSASSENQRFDVIPLDSIKQDLGLIQIQSNQPYTHKDCKSMKQEKVWPQKCGAWAGGRCLPGPVA